MMASAYMYPGLYTIGAAHINVKGICTNTTPVCAYRGAGRPEASYLIERLVDKAAREMGIGDGGDRARAAPGHRLGGLYRALRRRRPGDGRDRVHRGWPH